MGNGKNGNGNGKSRKEALEQLHYQVGGLQRQARASNIPVVIVFEGWDIWGRAEHINNLIHSLDPRGFDLHYMAEPTKDDKARPFLWRYYCRMPPAGRVSIFDRSWYFWTVYENFKHTNKDLLDRRLWAIRTMEEQHSQDGTVFLKFFLNLEKKDLRKVIEREAEDFCKRRVDHVNGDELLEHFDQAQNIWQKVTQGSDFGFAPWNVIKAEDEVEVNLKILEAISTNLRPVVENPTIRRVGGASLLPEPLGNGTIKLEQVDLGRTCPVDVYKDQLDRLQDRIRKLQCKLYNSDRTLVLVMEGWDASGKGGIILRLTNPLNPRAYQVAPVGPPNEVERKHHWLWRFYRDMPKKGRTILFDRSWYGRVLVERVEGFASEPEWKRAYHEINDMEKHLDDEGSIVMKFWLHIDKDTQMKRFQERQENPRKQWKITDEDWRNRDKWDQYVQAVNDMLVRTDTKAAPWYVVPSNDKCYARVKVLGSIADRLEKELGKV
jgi:polyphosphate:AMP phosphotransferase